MMRPTSMTAMRSAMVMASSWSWVTTTKVRPRSCCRSISSNWVSSRSFLSSAPSGSSSSSTFGRLAMRAGKGDALALAARKLMRLALAELLELDQLEHVGDAVVDLGLRHAVLLKAEGDVLLDTHVREQRVGLEHHVDRALVGRHAGEVFAVEQDPPLGRVFKSGQHAQQASTCRIPSRRAARRTRAGRCAASDP